MAEYTGMILTNSGKLMQAKAQLGEQLIITRVAVGDGALTSGENSKELTKLKSERLQLVVQDMTVAEEYQSRIRALLTNKNLTKGFFVREVGVFAKLGANGQETLYSYSNAGSMVDYLPADGMNKIEKLLEIYIVVGNTDNVSIIINGNAIVIEKYECGIKEKWFAADEWRLDNGIYKISIAVPDKCVCIGVDRTIASGSTRVIGGVEIRADKVVLESLEPYAGVAYFAAFLFSKSNCYKKTFTTADWSNSGVYKALTINYTEHSMGIDAIVESVEKQINNVLTNATVQVDRQPNGSIVIYAQEAFNGHIVLTGGQV